MKHADIILALHNGQLAGCGTHEQLLAQPGFYRDTFQQQIGEEELRAAG